MKGRIAQRGWVFALLPCACFLFSIASSNTASATPSGTINLYVGGGNGDGEPAIDASLDPRGLALAGDASAPDLYVADGWNNRVRHVDGQSGLIETIAGNGVSGYSGDGSQGQNASLWFPLDVAVDSAGNVYIADMMNNRIRKVGTDGRISTFAGNGQSTYSGEGIATQVAVYEPYGVTVGPDGNVYIADYGDNRIRVVSPPGCTPTTCMISTVAGTGTMGSSGDNGPATSALLNGPSDVAFDRAGNMYIDEYTGQRIRRVSSNGTITTVAGGGSNLPGTNGDGGPGILAVLSYPTQIAIDSSSNIYIAESSTHRVRMLQAGTSIISTVAGTGVGGWDGDGGAAVGADLQYVWGVAASTPGTFWLSQTVNQNMKSIQNRVRQVTNFGLIQTVIGGIGDGIPALSALVDPHGAQAVDTGGTLPDLYFADGSNNVVRHVDGDTGIIDNIAGTGAKGYSGDGGAATNATLNGPADVAVDAVNNVVYIADTGNNVIRKISPSGIISTVAGTGFHNYTGEGLATLVALATPNGIALDPSGNNLYIADHDNNRVREVSGGQMTTVASALSGPWDVAVANDGTLYIAEADGNRVRRVDTSGAMTTYAGGADGFAGDTGPATAAKFRFPTNLALDGAGNLFIADSNNYRIRRVDAVTHTIDTVAGNGQTTSSGDGGPATSAGLSYPSGVAVDPSGSPLFISTNTSYRVRIVESSSAFSPTPAFTLTPTPIPPTPIPPTPTNPPNTSTRTSTSIPQTPTRTGTPTKTATAVAGNVSVLGQVTYYANNQVPVPAVEINFTGPANQTVSTDSSGDYNATVLSGGSWNVEPAKLGSFGSAVSALDAARVLQLVAGSITFTALQRLACDVTGDGTVSALDAQRILQFSAGLITKFAVAQACGSDWLFYPASGQNPPTVGNGMCQQGNIVLPNLNSTVSNQNFTGILFGDCTGNWTPSGSGAGVGSALRAFAPSATVVRTGPLRSAPGHRVRLRTYVQARAAFSALDLKIAYDASALTFRSAVLHGAAAHALIGINSGQSGIVGVSLASAKPIKPTNGAVLVLEFDRSGTSSGAGAQLVGALVDEQSTRVAGAAH